MRGHKFFKLRVNHNKERMTRTVSLFEREQHAKRKKAEGQCPCRVHFLQDFGEDWVDSKIRVISCITIIEVHQRHDSLSITLEGDWRLFAMTKRKVEVKDFWKSKWCFSVAFELWITKTFKRCASIVKPSFVTSEWLLSSHFSNWIKVSQKLTLHDCNSCPEQSRTAVKCRVHLNLVDKVFCWPKITFTEKRGDKEDRSQRLLYETTLFCFAIELQAWSLFIEVPENKFEEMKPRDFEGKGSRFVWWKRRCVVFVCLSQQFRQNFYLSFDVWLLISLLFMTKKINRLNYLCSWFRLSFDEKQLSRETDHVKKISTLFVIQFTITVHEREQQQKTRDIL